jgi:hypothetical protein
MSTQTSQRGQPFTYQGPGFGRAGGATLPFLPRKKLKKRDSLKASSLHRNDAREVRSRHCGSTYDNQKLPRNISGRLPQRDHVRYFGAPKNERSGFSKGLRPCLFFILNEDVYTWPIRTGSLAAAHKRTEHCRMGARVVFAAMKNGRHGDHV